MIEEKEVGTIEIQKQVWIICYGDKEEAKCLTCDVLMKLSENTWDVTKDSQNGNRKAFIICKDCIGKKGDSAIQEFWKRILQQRMTMINNWKEIFCINNNPLIEDISDVPEDLKIEQTDDEEFETTTGQENSFIEKCLQSYKGKPSQIEVYSRNGAPNGIIQIVSKESRGKGAFLEHLSRSKFPILEKKTADDRDGNGSPVGTSVDHVIRIFPQKIYMEQKSSCFWGEDGGFVWQHIQITYPWHFLFLCGVEYKTIRFWLVDRNLFSGLLGTAITLQGGGSAEGYWFKCSNVDDVLRGREFKNQNELKDLLNKFFFGYSGRDGEKIPISYIRSTAAASS
jgi:hypothetical protein